ncbi:hypothetical protein GCM10028778_15260 [Barrientosiimonas marina]
MSAIRGKGLMIGIRCTEDIDDKVSSLMAKGLLVLKAGPRVIRHLRPLIVSEQEIDMAVQLISDVLTEEEADTIC